MLENGIADGSIKLPPPPKGIAVWPFIGTELDAFWSLASTNLQDALIEVEPQAQTLSKSLLRASAAASMAVLQVAAAIIIAGLFFGSGKSLVAAFGRSRPALWQNTAGVWLILPMPPCKTSPAAFLGLPCCKPSWRALDNLRSINRSMRL